MRSGPGGVRAWSSVGTTSLRDVNRWAIPLLSVSEVALRAEKPKKKSSHTHNSCFEFDDLSFRLKWHTARSCAVDAEGPSCCVLASL